MFSAPEPIAEQLGGGREAMGSRNHPQCTENDFPSTPVPIPRFSIRAIVFSNMLFTEYRNGFNTERRTLKVGPLLGYSKWTFRS
jgi:hypothetical protein